MRSPLSWFNAGPRSGGKLSAVSTHTGAGAAVFAGTRAVAGFAGPEGTTECRSIAGAITGEIDLSRASDSELVKAAADGDTAAFHALVDRHAKDLFRLAMSLSPTRSDAEDICQETLVGAFRGLSRFAGRASVKTWLMRILMRRAAKHWHKHRHVRKTLSLHNTDENSRHSERQDGLPTTPSGSAAVDQRIDLHAIIRTLIPEYREVILLRETHGLSYEEIATTLQIPRGTVESRLHRARLELRERMKDYLP